MKKAQLFGIEIRFVVIGLIIGLILGIALVYVLNNTFGVAFVKALFCGA